MGLVIGKTYYIKNVATGKYLNVYGNDTVANERNVNVYTKEDVLAQKWIVRLAGNGARVYTAINEAYALNINTSSNNCSMYVAASNSLADSVVDFLTVDASQNLYRIQMMAHGKYLTVNSSDNAYFGTDNESFYSLWQLEDADAAAPEPTPDPVPSAIANKTFFVKCYNTDYNLNVYGNDTVANNTNVTVYSKENVLAQKWVAKDTSAGPKLFTKINENFCLDIYTPNNNCDMYTASAGDDDTVLEFEPYNETQKIYKIKMFKHDKYLCADTLSDGGNVSWSSSSSGNTLWQFVDEDTMFPPANPTPEAIKGQEFYLRAGDSACYLNVHGTDTVAVGRNANVYSKDKCKAQCWIPDDHYNKPRLFTKINRAFGLNIYSDTNPNCTMYTVEGNDEDSVLQFENVASKQYRIKMHYHNKYLAVDGEITSGANVVWVDGASAATIWTFETESEAFVPAPAAPTAIVDKTCFVRADGTEYYLNVHGSDTVANTRNVDVFTAENCRAQRWIARGTAKDPKLHTAIDETFALNIYKEDCTMYTAAGNDMDSILEFVHVSGMKYRIKMFHHNKYLAINGTPSIGADVIWVDTAAAANVWEFISEENMTLPEGGVPDTFTADSSLVTTVVPAHTNNFTPNRSTNGSPISEICIHHAAGNITVNNLGALWQNPNRAGSSHYGVNGTQVGQYVKESDIAWTNGHWESNKRSVTIETANSSSAPDWLISDETLNTLINLVADIARRNNLGKLVVGENLTYHSMYSATLCPGPYLLSKLTHIANKANELNEIIEVNANNMVGGTYYVKNLTTNSYLNVVEESNNINVTSAYDVSAQKWNVVSSGTSLKVLSNITGTPSLKVGENNICQLNLSRSTENCDIELVPYVDNNFKYSDNVFRIKVKDEDLYLATDEDTNTEVCWTTFSKSMLWKFISPFDIIPEIKDNTLRLFLETFKTVMGFDNDIITAVIELHKKTFNIDTVYLDFATIKASCDVALNYESDEGYGANITIDPDEVESGTIGYENYLFGLETTLEDFNDITNIGDLIQKIKDVGVLLKGGNFAFKSSISDARKGKFDILCNIDLMPDHPKTHLEMAITFHIDIDFDNNSSIKFNPQCAEVPDEFILMFISILLLVLIITGRGAIILKFLSKLVALFPLRSVFILG